MKLLLGLLSLISGIILGFFVDDYLLLGQKCSKNLKEAYKDLLIEGSFQLLLIIGYELIAEFLLDMPLQEWNNKICVFVVLYCVTMDYTICNLIYRIRRRYRIRKGIIQSNSDEI